MSDSRPTVLIVEDEAHMRSFLATTLSYNGYQTLEAGTGRLALEMMRKDVSLVLLDLGLPDTDGTEIASQMRVTSAAPIIVLSARDQERSKIDALDRGANDYVTKPFGAGELLARIRVALRPAARVEAPAAVFTVGDLRIDRERRLAFLGKEEIHLTPTEFDILRVLVNKAGRVVSHRELLRSVWGPDRASETQYLRVFMRQLRFKLEPEPAQPRYLITVPSVGYRLRTDD